MDKNKYFVIYYDLLSRYDGGGRDVDQFDDVDAALAFIQDRIDRVHAYEPQEVNLNNYTLIAGEKLEVRPTEKITVLTVADE